MKCRVQHPLRAAVHEIGRGPTVLATATATPSAFSVGWWVEAVADVETDGRYYGRGTADNGPATPRRLPRC